MLKVLVLASAAIVLASCAVAFTQIRLADGRRAYVMDCSGIEVNRNDCARLARRLCPRGYQYVDNRTLQNGVDSRRYGRIIGQPGNATVTCR